MVIEIAMHPVINRALLASSDADDLINGVALCDKQHRLNSLVYFGLLSLMKSHCQPTPIMVGETEFCWTSRFSRASSINSKIFFAKTCGYLHSKGITYKVVSLDPAENLVRKVQVALPVRERQIMLSITDVVVGAVAV